MGPISHWPVLRLGLPNRRSRSSVRAPAVDEATHCRLCLGRGCQVLSTAERPHRELSIDLDSYSTPPDRKRGLALGRSGTVSYRPLFSPTILALSLRWLTLRPAPFDRRAGPTIASRGAVSGRTTALHYRETAPHLNRENGILEDPPGCVGTRRESLIVLRSRVRCLLAPR